jgi:hypothetical protein
MEANRGDLKAIQQMEPSGPDGGERAELGEPVKDCIADFRANGFVLVLKDGAFEWRASKYACLRFLGVHGWLELLRVADAVEPEEPAVPWKR